MQRFRIQHQIAILLCSLSLVLPDKAVKKDDLEGRIKVREISHEELSYGGYAAPYGIDTSYPLGFSSEALGYGPPAGYRYPPPNRPIYDVPLRHNSKEIKAVSKGTGIVQKAFQKGLKKLTGLFIGEAEPVVYERPPYYEPPLAPRYVEVKVPKCKHRLEVPIYVTETLIRTSEYPVTKIHTKTKRVNVKEYVVNTKYHTVTQTKTAYVTHHEPPKTVYNTVTVTHGYEKPAQYNRPLEGHYSVIHDDSYGEGPHESSYEKYNKGGQVSLEGSVYSYDDHFSKEGGHHKQLQAYIQDLKPVDVDFKLPKDIEFHHPPKLHQISVLDTIDAVWDPAVGTETSDKGTAFQYQFLPRSLAGSEEGVIAVLVPSEKISEMMQEPEDVPEAREVEEKSAMEEKKE